MEADGIFAYFPMIIVHVEIIHNGPNSSTLQL